MVFPLQENIRVTHDGGGKKCFSTYSNWFGASFSFKDIGEFGDNVDKEKNFSPDSALPFKPHQMELKPATSGQAYLLTGVGEVFL